MKRKHKKYSKPKRPFDKPRIIEEEKIKKEFGLKNKKEIWKTESKVKTIRRKAKNMISSNVEEQKKLFERLRKIGLNVNSIADALSLGKEDYLKRRLQTVIVTKKIARTPKHARQLIVHKKILIGGRVINSPSYIVPVELENKISIKPEKEKKVRENPDVQEIKQEIIIQ
ncbi:30S ribosomal protein S4 [Candidatus Pacearchaeota archaeon]|nr:30S ribosomal protein S4 [Candidatus Pacearchaeota archaeon]